jgi:hypothetical protein
MARSRTAAVAVNQIRGGNPRRDTPRKSSSSLNELQERVRHALKNLGDRTALNRSPLAKLEYVERLATAQYSGHLLPRGLALHDILIQCVDRVSTELGNEPALRNACTYLELLTSGASCREISKQLGLSREHVSRVYRKKAIDLACEEFFSMVHNGR